MVVTTTNKSSRKKSFWGNILTTDLTTVYTCPQNCNSEVTFLHIVNVTGNNSVNLYWYVAVDNYSSHFVGGKNMSAAEYITFSPMQLILSPGDKINVQTTAAAHVDVIVSVTETFVPLG
jgi:hypothetical protein